MRLIKAKSYTIVVLFRCFVIALAVLTAHDSWAAIYLGQTRLIIDDKEQEVSIRIKNQGEKPVLLQSWVDLGEIDEKPENLSVPFVITPPIVRLDGEKEQRLRVMYTGDKNTLPSDRESVYWFNVLEIPPKSAGSEGKDKIQMAFRTRIKLFYRPQKVRTMDLSHIPDQLRFSLENKILRVENSTPVNQTLLSAAIGSNSKNPALVFKIDTDMIAPFSTTEYVLMDNQRPVNTTMKVFITTINDYGITVESESNVDFK